MKKSTLSMIYLGCAFAYHHALKTSEHLICDYLHSMPAPRPTPKTSTTKWPGSRQRRAPGAVTLVRRRVRGDERSAFGCVLAYGRTPEGWTTPSHPASASRMIFGGTVEQAMIKMVHTRLSAVPANSGKRALVIEDQSGRFDDRRHVSYDQDGATFYWSTTSIQADFASTLALAESWAMNRSVPTVYIC